MSREANCLLVAVLVGSVSLLASLGLADDKKAAAKDDKKVAAKDDGKAEAADDTQLLEGKWVAVSSELNGRKILVKDLPAKAPRPTIVFKDGKGTYNLRRGAQGRGGPMLVVVDATKTPKTLDLQMNSKMANGPTVALKGIYQVDGDTLMICYNNPTPGGATAAGGASGGDPRGVKTAQGQGLVRQNAAPGLDPGRPKEIKADPSTVIVVYQRQKP
jgi:uncharacterized protein (TIGR03067 family)